MPDGNHPIRPSCTAGDSGGPTGRALFVTSNFPRWEGDGTTPFLLHLAQDLQALGWRVDVLAPHAPAARTRDSIGGVEVARFRYLWPESLETVCYGGGALINLRRDPGNLFKLPALVAAEAAATALRLLGRRYDIVHSHWILPQGFVGALMTGPLGVPHVVTAHGNDIFALQGALLARFKRFALGRASAVTVNSRATEQAVRALAPDLAALHCIPMGTSEPVPDPEAVAAARARYRQGAGPLLAFAGRLVKEKGVADLLHAVALLRPRLPDLRLVVAGEGPERAAFERLAGELGIAERVAFAGWQGADQVPHLMAAADAYVGPSRRGPDGTAEAQGLTFAEAMLAGTPVIATRLGGIVDAVRHEDTGLLVDEAAPDQIAAAVERLARRPDLAAQLSANGRRLAKDVFTRAASARAFADLYAGLAAPAKRPAKRPARRAAGPARRRLMGQAAMLRPDHLMRQAVLLSGVSDSLSHLKQRYRPGGTSGSGSMSRLAAFKAEVLNGFVRDRGIESVVEFGCGDGRQLALSDYPLYLGLDASKTSIAACWARFADDPDKSFLWYDPALTVNNDNSLCADLALSLDVVHRLVEDAVYEKYLDDLFAAARRSVIIYASDKDERTAVPHVRHRAFTGEVARRYPDFRLTATIRNRYPDQSDSSFFIFDRTESSSE